MEMKSRYDTQMFGEIFPTLDDWLAFINDYWDLTNVLDNDHHKILYYLLTARYTNDPICNFSVEQFYIKVASIIFQFGPTWQKRLEIQENLRTLSETDLITGTKQIYNEAYNPNTTPSTDTTDEVNYINSQKVSKIKRNKLDAYQVLWDSLRTDVTENFIREFRKCFSPFTISAFPTIYITTDYEED